MYSESHTRYVIMLPARGISRKSDCQVQTPYTLDNVAVCPRQLFQWAWVHFIHG